MNQAVAISLVYNTPHLVESIRRQLPGVRIVDNGSLPPACGAWLRIPVNRYFSGGMNRAMEQIHLEGKYRWAWMLNSDVSGATPPMMQQLLDVAESRNLVAVSPSVPKSWWPQMRAGECRPVGMLEWVAPLVNVEWFIRSGGFDERFYGWGGDLDLCYRTRDQAKGVFGGAVLEHEYHGTGRHAQEMAMFNRYWRELILHKHGPSVRAFAPQAFV